MPEPADQDTAVQKQDEKEAGDEAGVDAKKEEAAKPTELSVQASASPEAHRRTTSGGSSRHSSAKKKGKRKGSPKKKSPTRSPKGERKHKEKEEVNKEEEPEEEVPELREGIRSIFLSTRTQEIFNCVTDIDVTQEKPHKTLRKEDIVMDMKARAAVSDFHPFKQEIMDFPGEEILLTYDYEFLHGNNFLIALTEEAMQETLVGVVEEDEEEIVYKYVPPEPKDWVSLGSEREIEEERVSETRPRIVMRMLRKRREFGSFVKFSDRGPADVKDGFVDCLPYEDQSFDTSRIEMEKSIQAIPDKVEEGAQTTWRYPRNAWTQYSPRKCDPKHCEELCKSPEMDQVTKAVMPRFEEVLTQNEMVNIFYDDWAHLAINESLLGTKGETHLKEYQSFTDLKFSKNKTVTWVDWHPSIKGVLACAVTDRYTFDEAVDNIQRTSISPSLIMVWSFVDPIHPQLLLEAPDSVWCFQFCPTNPNIVSAGCQNGQVALWDITQYEDKLMATRGKSKHLDSLPGFEQDDPNKIPVMRWAAVSSIDHGHHGPICDIMWVPDHLEINKLGEPKENKEQKCVQIFTCSTDCTALLWDTRPIRGLRLDDKIQNPMGVPDTFRYLDLIWKPLLRITLYKSEPGGDHAPTRLSIQEKQGDRSVLESATEGKDYTQTLGGDFQMGGKPSSAKEKKTLQGVKTHFYLGTEDGELVYVDWMPQKDQDTGKIQTPKPAFYQSIHAGPIQFLGRSPFFKDIVLCVGGWTFSVWKEGMSSGPIIACAACEVRMTNACWSNSRPAVFYIAREDGGVDIWDLLDRTHEKALTQYVTANSITYMTVRKITSKQYLLAIGDRKGTLHILEVPGSLRDPVTDELNMVQAYLEREVARRKFVMERWNIREEEKRQIEVEAKRKAGIAPHVQLSEDEENLKMKLEYQQFVEDEENFLRELGLLKDEDEPLNLDD